MIELEFIKEHEDMIHWAFEIPFPISASTNCSKQIELAELARKQVGYGKWTHWTTILESLQETYLYLKLKDVPERFKNAKGERHNDAKLDNSKVVRIRMLYKTGNYTHRELAKEFGVSHRVIGKAINRQTWNHIP